ncbi:hypothetical protein ACT4S5_13200 [Kocuria oceani]|uniref:hypothetical protein n=1 Tax=Kocuria oceani TaxID=988827 RepID=UPI004035A81B
MRTSLRLNFTALGFLFAGALFMARGMAEGKGTMPKGRDRRAAAGMLAVAAALFLTAGAFLMAGD